MNIIIPNAPLANKLSILALELQSISTVSELVSVVSMETSSDGEDVEASTDGCLASICVSSVGLGDG